jgi:hypothetical protein
LKVESVLALQRAIGNGAVARFVESTRMGGDAEPPDDRGDEVNAGPRSFAARGSTRDRTLQSNVQRDPDGGAPVGAPPMPGTADGGGQPAPELSLDDRYKAAVAAGQWGEAALLLNRFNDTDIDARVRALGASERASVRGATPQWAHRVRRPLLDLDFQDAVKAGKWSDASTLLNGFNAADIAERVGGLSSAQRIELYVASPDWAKPVLDAIATADLDAAFKGAIRKNDWQRVAVLLNGFNDADIDARVKALSAADRASLRGAIPEWAHRVRRPLLDLDYQDAVKSGKWSDAATILNGFNDADIEARVNALTPPQREALRAATPDWAHRVRRPLLLVDIDAASAAGDWDKAALLFNGLNDADIIARLAALGPDTLRLLDDGGRRAMPGFSDRLHRLITAALGGGPTAEPGQQYGTLTATVGSIVNGDAATNKNYKYPITITFLPNASVVNATEIAFVQRVRLVQTGTNTNMDWDPTNQNRATPHSSSVDRLPGREQGWYGYNNTGAGGNVTPWTPGSPGTPATMTDTPSQHLPNTTWEFETSAAAKGGADSGLVYAVVTWGFTVDANLHITALPTAIFNKPTGEFHQATGAWNTQASGPAANRNAPGQKPLPTFH